MLLPALTLSAARPAGSAIAPAPSLPHALPRTPSRFRWARRALLARCAGLWHADDPDESRPAPELRLRTHDEPRTCLRCGDVDRNAEVHDHDQRLAVAGLASGRRIFQWFCDAMTHEVGHLFGHLDSGQTNPASITYPFLSSSSPTSAPSRSARRSRCSTERRNSQRRSAPPDFLIRTLPGRARDKPATLSGGNPHLCPNTAI